MVRKTFIPKNLLNECCAPEYEFDTCLYYDGYGKNEDRENVRFRLSSEDLERNFSASINGRRRYFAKYSHATFVCLAIVFVVILHFQLMIL